MDESTGQTFQHRRRRGNPVGALLFICLGALLLFNNFGWLPWSTWQVVWQFWPALLIIWGLQLLLGRGTVAHFVVSLITLAIIALVIWYVLISSSSPAGDWLKNRYPTIGTPTYISYPQSRWN